MEQPARTPAFYIKTAILVLALFAESFFLTRRIIEFIGEQRFFAANLDFMTVSAGIILLMLITNALLVGAWGKWEQFILTPLPVAIGIFAAVFVVNSAYAVVLAVVVFGLLSYDIMLATQLKSQMLVFNPRLVMRFASKGLVVSFSITAAVLVIISAGTQPELNIGERVGEFAEEHFAPQLNQKLNEQIQAGVSPGQLDKLSALGLDPSEQGISEQGFLLELFANLPSIPTPNISIKDTISTEVNKVVEPYKRFVNPIMAAVVFGLLQFIGFVTIFIYTFIIDLIYLIAKKTGFLKVRLVQVEKEELYF